MKKIFLGLMTCVLLSTLAFAGGDKNQNRHDGELGQGPTKQVRLLTPDQEDSIYRIYEEEKLARDVYRMLGEIYSEENTFANIQLSEQTHMDAVRNLCDKYGIEIPISDARGVFTISDMEEFYATVYQIFITDESGSLLKALYIGKEIEEMDIDDLALASVGMPKDVTRVFTNLMNGSLNHLDAFENAITRVEGLQ
jgi:hypothetical protein